MGACPADKLTGVLVARLTDAGVAAAADFGSAAHAHAVRALAPDHACFGAGGTVGAADDAALPCTAALNVLLDRNACQRLHISTWYASCIIWLLWAQGGWGSSAAAQGS